MENVSEQQVQFAKALKKYGMDGILKAIHQMEMDELQEAVERINVSDDELYRMTLEDESTPGITSAQRGLSRRDVLDKLLPFEWSNKIEATVASDFNRCCALTGQKNDVVLDHFIPVSWGHGGTYRGNVILLSAVLNKSKDNRNPFEWIKDSRVKSKVDIERWHKLIQYLSGLHGLTIEEYERYVYWCSDNRRVATNPIKFTSLATWKAIYYR